MVNFEVFLFEILLTKKVCFRAELTKNDLIIKNKTGVSVTEKARIAMGTTLILAYFLFCSLKFQLGVTYSVGTCNTKLLNKKFVIVLTTKHGPVYLQVICVML